MAIDINVRISAEPALVNALEAIANAVAVCKITALNDNKPIESSKQEKPVPKPQAKPEEPKEEAPKAEAAEPEPNPDDIIDKSLIPSIRKTAGTFSASRPDGKEVIKKWLNDNGFKGLASLTYKGAEDFTAFLENEVKKNA